MNTYECVCVYAAMNFNTIFANWLRLCILTMYMYFCYIAKKQNIREDRPRVFAFRLCAQTPYTGVIHKTKHTRLCGTTACYCKQVECVTCTLEQGTQILASTQLIRLSVHSNKIKYTIHHNGFKYTIN